MADEKILEKASDIVEEKVEEAPKTEKKIEKIETGNSSIMMFNIEVPADVIKKDAKPPKNSAPSKKKAPAKKAPAPKKSLEEKPIPEKKPAPSKKINKAPKKPVEDTTVKEQVVEAKVEKPLEKKTPKDNVETSEEKPMSIDSILEEIETQKVKKKQSKQEAIEEQADAPKPTKEEKEAVPEKKVPAKKPPQKAIDKKAPAKKPPIKVGGSKTSGGRLDDDALINQPSKKGSKTSGGRLDDDALINQPSKEEDEKLPEKTPAPKKPVPKKQKPQQKPQQKQPVKPGVKRPASSRKPKKEKQELPVYLSWFIPTSTDDLYEILRKGLVIVCALVILFSMGILIKSTHLKSKASDENAGTYFANKYTQSFEVNDSDKGDT